MNDSSDAVTFTADDRAFVYAVIRRIVRNEDDANDATQEAMLAAYRHRGSYAGRSRYRTWLYRVAVTAALTALRRERRRGRSTDLDAVAEQPEAVTDHRTPERALVDAQCRQSVRRSVAGLDPRYARVLELRLDDDLPENEIAQRLGLSVATVKIRGHRARLALRSVLASAW